MEGIIDHGEIKSPCLYARNGAKNALVSVDSEEYKAVLEQTEKRKNVVNVKISEIPVGSKVTMIRHGGSEDLWYLGKIWVGFELQWIFDNFTNLPRSWTGRVQSWYGDHAKFIIGRIMKYD